MQEYTHITVMAEEAIEMLNVKPGGIYYDATLGGGGHSREILKRGGRIIATDLDDDAINNSINLQREYEGRVQVIKGNFKDAVKILKGVGVDRVDGVIADLGLSSNQIENSRRGFSFSENVPLDMRFDPSQRVPAYQFLKEVNLKDLVYALENFADIRNARRLAEYIKQYFNNDMENDASQFASYLRKSRFVPHPGRIDPATRIFMAIRMMVNDEVGNLTEFLMKLPMMVKDGTRVVIITFHSVEDRIVKNIFRKFVKQDYIEMDGITLRAELINRKVITPSNFEIRMNLRSRSAKMRAIRFFECEKED
ncbi:MAG: 16S rRNA (cytosine(1402)-N(4))-methyltransferase RsmH [Myxococcota bacterium]